MLAAGALGAPALLAQHARPLEIDLLLCRPENRHRTNLQASRWAHP